MVNDMGKINTIKPQKLCMGESIKILLVFANDANGKERMENGVENLEASESQCTFPNNISLRNTAHCL